MHESNSVSNIQQIMLEAALGLTLSVLLLVS